MERVIFESLNLIPSTLGKVEGVDLDALSLTISHNARLTEDQKGKVRNLLHFFGTDNSDITLAPSTGPASREGIFGTPEKGTIHLEVAIRENESIITNTPVKLATLNLDNCVSDIVEEISNTFWLEKSKTKGLCFNTNIATNLPTYGYLTKILVEKSYHGSMKNKFFLHVANLGKRANIVADFQNNGTFVRDDDASSLWHLFQLIDDIRKSGVTVSVLQLDIAFKSKPPGSENHLAGMSLKKKKDSEETRILRKGEVFPTEYFDIEKREDEQRGTIRLSHDLSRMKNFDSVRNNESNLQWQIEDNPFPLFSEILTCDECESGLGETSEEETNDEGTNQDRRHDRDQRDAQGETGYAFSRFSIHSVKSYNQTSVHAALQERKTTGPLKNYPTTMYYLQQERFDKLKKIVKDIDDGFSRSSKATRNIGAVVRTEVSVRPIVNSTLRTCGHLVDLLLHVYLGIWSLSNQWTVNLYLHDPHTVRLKLTILMKQLWNVLCCRGSLLFDEQYKSKKYHDWLKFMMSTILVIAGYGPAYKLKFQRSWYKTKINANFFDPYGVVDKLNFDNFLGPRTLSESANDDVQLTPPENLTSIFVEQGKLSRQGASTVENYVKECFRKKNVNSRMKCAVECFQELSLYDKLNIIGHLDEIIAKLSEEEDEGNGGGGEEQVQMDEEIFAEGVQNDFSAYDQPSDITNNANNDDRLSTHSPPEDIILALSELVLGSSTTEEDPQDPTVRTIQYLHLLPNVVFSHRNYTPPHVKLFDFIRWCHENSIILPRDDCPLQNLDQQTLNILSDAQIPNARNWKSLMSKLKIQQKGRNDIMIKALCRHYYFPHPETSVNEEIVDTSMNENNEYMLRMNDMLNEILSKVVVRTTHITLYSKTLRRYGLGGGDVTIIRGDKLVEKQSIMQPISYIWSSEATLLLPLMIGLGYTEYDIEEIIPPSNFAVSLVDELKSRDGFQHMIMYSDGQYLKEFENLEIVQSLLPYLSTKMNPRVILPIVSLLREENILMYDFIVKETFLYLSQNAKTVIVYKMDDNEFRPRIKTKNFIYERSHITSEISFRPIKTDAALPSYETFLAKLTTTVGNMNIEQEQQCVNYRREHFPKWDLKKCKHRHFIDAAYEDFGYLLQEKDLIDLQNKIQNDENIVSDKLTLSEYMNELMHRLNHTDRRSQVKEALFENFPDDFAFSTDLRNGINEQPYHLNMAPFLCLKYKVVVVVWTTIRNQRETLKTEMLYFDPFVNKVKYILYKKEKKVFPHCRWICYFRYDQDKELYGCCKTNDQVESTSISHLYHPYSFPQDSFMKTVIDNITGSCYIQFTGSEVLPVDCLAQLQDTREPIILLRKLYERSNGPYMLRRRDEYKHLFVGWFVLCIYPYDNNTRKQEIRATCFSRELSNNVKTSAETIIVDTFEETRLRASEFCNLKVVEFQEPLASQNCSCDSGFYALMTAFIASIAIVPTEFEACMSSISNEAELLSKMKIWLIRSAMSNIEIKAPFWMRRRMSLNR